MISRKVEEKIFDWIHNSSKALLVTGARQVGKTYVFAHCNIEVDGKIIYYPIYMCCFLTEEISMPILHITI